MYLAILTRKWKWLFVNGYICNSLIYTMKEFLNPSQSLGRYIIVLQVVIHKCSG
jgi:hypothetical protein